MFIETPRMIIRDFTPEDAADLHGNWVDLYLYGLLEDDWRKL